MNNNNLNIQGNNGISNNQPLQNSQNLNNSIYNSNMQQNTNFNQPAFNNQSPIQNNQNLNNNSYENAQQSQNINKPIFNNELQSQVTVNKTQNYEQTFQPTNEPNLKSSYPKKPKINLGLLIGVVIGIIVIGIIVFVINNNNTNRNNNNNSTNNSTNKEDIVYYDNTRELKDSYTFEEATSKFAFLVGNSTLIFEEKNKVTFDDAILKKTIYGELSHLRFNYKQDIYTSLSNIHVGESNSSNLEKFISNFKNGILSDKLSYTVKDINIIETTDDYVFASWTKEGTVTNYEHYFAKKIDDKVYYVYHTSIIKPDDTKINLLLNEFKELFTCLSKDDRKTPYIQDKIMNVPIVLNKQIKDVTSIFAISKSTNGYLEGSVMFTLDNIDNINLEYGSSGHYKRIDWTKDLTHSIKYRYEDNKNIFGVIDNDLTQIFEISSSEEINTEKEFNNYINKIFIDK